MRIIAGEFRGRPLISPPSQTTRPITDRAKQSLFDAVAVAVELPGAAVLDCFSGTGSMGLECLSRGARFAVFIERDREALQALGNNLRALDVIPRSSILPMDAYGMAKNVQRMIRDCGRFRLAFVDPPYAHVKDIPTRLLIDNLIEKLSSTAMEPESLIVLRHSKDTDISDMALSRRIVRRLQYGSMAITWLAGGVGPSALTTP